MRKNIKRLLQFTTAALVALFVVVYIYATITKGTSGYLFEAQLIAAPFELFSLVVLWICYATLPSLFRSLAGSGGSKRGKTGATLQKTQANASVRAFQAISILSIAFIVCGVLVLSWFCYVGGPNQGQGRHIFASSNLYMDMQVGLGCMAIGCVLALANYTVSKSLR